MRTWIGFVVTNHIERRSTEGLRLLCIALSLSAVTACSPTAATSSADAAALDVSATQQDAATGADNEVGLDSVPDQLSDSTPDAPANPDVVMTACESPSGTTQAFYSCVAQSDCQPGLACVGTAGVSGSFYCKPVCSSQADCSSWKASYPSVSCVQNACPDKAGTVGICNDHPSDSLVQCCAATSGGTPDATDSKETNASQTDADGFAGGVGTTTVAQDGFVLNFESKDPNLQKQTALHLIQCFFSTIPKEAKRFNPSCAHTVSMTVDPAYAGAAATLGASITVSAGYIDGSPEDYDIITHEAMHVVQAYDFANVQSYWVEGLADYARYVYGVNNDAAGWSLTEYAPGQKYTDSYRVTARFLVWAATHIKASIPDDMDEAIRAGTFTENTFWGAETGQTVQQLWAKYSADPGL